VGAGCSTRGAPHPHSLRANRLELGRQPGAVLQVAPGQAVHLNAEGGEAPVAAATFVERAPRAMKGLAVELNGRPRIRPVRVDLMARDEDAGAGPRQAVLEAQLQEEAPARLRVNAGSWL
jgi:hypothetical protein